MTRCHQLGQHKCVGWLFRFLVLVGVICCLVATWFSGNLNLDIANIRRCVNDAGILKCILYNQTSELHVKYEKSLELEDGTIIRENYNCTEQNRYKECPPGYFMWIPRQSEDIVWVRPTGDYFTRLSAYNKALGELRTKVLYETRNKSWVPVHQRLQFVWSKNTFTYLNITSRHPYVTTLALAFDRTYIDGNIWHSDEDKNNLVIQEYYQWTATDKMCRWLNSNTSDIPAYGWGAMFRKRCFSDIQIGLRRAKLKPMYLNAKRPVGPPITTLWYKKNTGFFPADYYFTLVNYVHYIQVIKYGFIDTVGDVYTDYMKLVAFSCASANPNEFLKKTRDFNPNARLLQEVFVISQLYNDVLYHSSIEDLPRAVPFLEFLKNNPQILIHTGPKKAVWVAMFELMGIASNRFVSGPMRARIVYLPQHTSCGLNQVQALQLTRHLILQKLSELYPEDKRNSILIIKRGNFRRLVYHNETQKGLLKLAEKHKMRLEVFSVKPLPTLHTIFRMFRRARVIVGPHGAGFLNLVFAAPGTLVVEGVCHRRSMVLYYLWEAHTLGQRWHGVPGKTDRCGNGINSPPQEILRVVRNFLDKS